MGMEIFHDQATLKRDGSIYTQASFETANLPYSAFADYVQTFERVEMTECLIVIRQDVYQRRLKEYGSLNHHPFNEAPKQRIIFDTPSDELQEKLIRERLARKGSKGLQFMYHYHLNPHNAAAESLVLNFGKPRRFEGICFKSVASYNGRAMRADFDLAFSSDRNYCLKADVLKARDYVLTEYYPENLSYFQQNFIDNFVEGRSIMSYIE